MDGSTGPPDFLNLQRGFYLVLVQCSGLNIYKVIDRKCLLKCPILEGRQNVEFVLVVS